MSGILGAVETFVTHLLSEELDTRYLYHNLTHTQRVLQSTKELLGYYDLDENDRKALLLAAWLHDTGYIRGWEGHEKESSRIAEKFLSEQGLGQERIGQVCRLILATERYHKPANLLEEIIRDADASHLGKKYFIEVSELLKEELALMDIAHYTQEDWRELNIEILRNEHHYYTAYARKHWQPEKDKNLRNLLEA
jgi:predicted metal-dependent HD superfamily phosphohydrolase